MLLKFHHVTRYYYYYYYMMLCKYQLFKLDPFILLLQEYGKYRHIFNHSECMCVRVCNYYVPITIVEMVKMQRILLEANI